MLVDSGRRVETDKKFDSDEADTKFSNLLFVRLVAKGKTFTKVDFRYSIFENCYIRDCRFDSCNFTGCRFIGTNLHGSKFSGCAFDYAIFEKTFVDAEILDTECPAHENLTARFARTLRTNYQQLGDAAGANRAIKVELAATEVHLHKAWKSSQSYYRKKYRGWFRFASWVEWVKFKVLHYVWGNGESTLRLAIFVFVILGLMAVIDVWAYGDTNRIDSYGNAIALAPQIFLGVLTPESYPKWYLASITLLRLVTVGFLLAIVVKRFNRR